MDSSAQLTCNAYIHPCRSGSKDGGLIRMKMMNLPSNSNTQNNLVGRRKFNVLNEISAGVRRFKHQQCDEWTYIPDKKIVKQMTYDFMQKKLYVNGMDFTCTWTREEILKHITVLPKPEEKEIPTGKKLHAIPLFVVEECHLSTQFLGRSINYIEPVASTRQMIAEYMKCETRHKTQEHHHPDGLGWNGGITSTIECVFDVFNSILREKPLKQAYETLLSVLMTDKFINLDPAGIYAALLHIIIRGVAGTEQLRASSAWRRSKNQEQLMRTHLAFKRAGNRPTRDLHIGIRILDYHCETALHRLCIEKELKLLRVRASHDNTKFEPKMKYWYTWYWGVYQQASEVNRYRMLSDKDTTIEEVFTAGRETMMASAGNSFAKGIAESQELKDSIREITREVMTDATTQLRSELKSEFTDIKKDATELLKEMTGRAEEISESTISRTSQIVNKLTSSLDSVTAMMESIKTMASSFLTNCMSTFRSLPGMGDIDINLDTIIAAIRDWILYINVESPVLKSILIVSILNHLGLLKSGYNFFLGLWEYLKETFAGKANVDGETLEGSETSSVFGFMAGSVSNMVHVIAGVTASIAKGSILTSTQFWSICEHLAGRLKNIHFIGAGLMGFTRIFDFIVKIYSGISEWISKHLFKRTPDIEVLAKKVLVWVVKVKYFSTEAGLDSIRLNAKMREIATKLHPEFLSLSISCRSKPEYRVLLADVERHKKQVSDIYDYITRLEAVSTFCPTMFHIQFVGQPGVGKSFLFKSFVDNIQSTLWPEDPGNSFYSFNPNLEFFDGYAGQRIFYIDDCFRMQEPKHLTTLIGLVTNTPVILPMANLTDKGTQLTSDVMISSTNTAWPIGKDVLCMEAVHRRRHMLVEVEIDPRVRDESTGAFSLPLYKKYYDEKDIGKFPHLKFNLLRPVPKQMEKPACVQQQDTNEFTQLQEFAKKLQEANVKIMTPFAEGLSETTDPMFFFSDENKPPEGITLPCTGWTYEQLVHNFIVRYRAFRGLERSYTTQRKYAHAENALSEIENLFYQQDDILHDEAITLPKVKLVEKWFSDVHHPYGSSDPIGQKIVQNPDCDLAPDLDDIDFEKLVEESLNDKVETMMNNEDTNTRRIRERMARMRNMAPPAERNRLRQVLVNDNTGSNLYIPLTENPTIWDNYSISKSHSKFKILRRNWEAKQLRELYDEFMTDMSASTGHGFFRGVWDGCKASFNFRQEMLKYVYGSLAHFPDSDAFAEKRRQKSTFPLYFLQRLEYKFGKWSMNVTDLDYFTQYRKDAKITYDPVVHVSQNGEWYSVPVDIAFLLSLSDVFRTFNQEFLDMTLEQQQLLVEDAKWRNVFTGKYTLQSFRASCKSVIVSGCVRAAEYLLAPIHYLFHKVPCIVQWTARTCLFAVAIWALRSVSNLILGTKEETSKYLHRGPVSNIQYKGNLTAMSTPIMSTNEAEAYLQRNVRQITVSDSHSGALVQALLHKQYILFNAHALRELKDSQIVLAIHLPGSDEKQTYIIPRENFYVHEDGDLAVCWHRSLPAARDIFRFLMTDEEFTRMEFTESDLILLSRFKNIPSIEYHPFVKVALKPTLTTPQNPSGVSLDRALILDGHTIVGKSGSTALFQNKQAQFKIAGLQAWSLGGNFKPQIAVQVLTQEMLEPIFARMDDKYQPVTRLADYEGGIVGTLPAAFTSAEFNNVVAMVPQSESAGQIGKTQFAHTPISSFMAADGYQSERCPAALHPGDPRLNSDEHPMKHSLGKYFRGSVEAFDPKILNYLRKGMGAWISSKLDKQVFRSLTMEEIVTGTREDGSNPMNLSSSPGIPYIFSKQKKGKRDFFEINEEGMVSHLDTETVMAYKIFLNSLQNRKLPLTRAYDFPKDELRPIGKALGTNNSPPKTRTVTCMNMMYVLAWRETTLDFWASMHRAADGTFPFCPGINPEGPEWSAAYHYLNIHPNAVDFDVSNWDGYLPPCLLYLAGDIVSDVSGLSQENRNVVDSILFEVINCYIQYGRHIYKKSRGMVSGFPGTAEMNSLVHWILIMYIYLLLTQNEPQFHSIEAFKQNVSCLVYGDDIIITFSDEILHIFNGLTISNMYEMIGYPVTSADKGSQIVERKQLSDCQFLKSSWNRLFQGVYIRTMDLQVANDLLYWVRAKEHPVQQFYINVIDALRIVFGHGERVFDAYVKRMNQWLSKARLPPVLYTYSDFYSDYIQRYYQIETFKM
ncbi:putative RNA-dependent RNA polymerase complex [Linepithema humile polycipivirus 2]|nr:putative RNA-dependent RNA polymerase complex [Linepithema humile polycipivirus 2]